MRCLGHTQIFALHRLDTSGDNAQSTATVPPGDYTRANEDTLRRYTGLSLKSLFAQIAVQNSPHASPGLSPHTTMAMLQRSSSTNPANSPRRLPSWDEAQYTSHILVSLPIPESVATAVCELWEKRLQAAQLWWLSDIDFDAASEEALFAVVRLALIERVRQGQLRPRLPQEKRPAEGVVMLFNDEASRATLQKAIESARALTAGDKDKVRLLNHVLQRRVMDPEYAVQEEEIPHGDDEGMWQAYVTTILRHVCSADGALRDSDLIDALRMAWEQIHIIAG